MVKAIRVYEHGGPEVLKWEDVEIGEPQDGEIRVKNKAVGLNFTDTYFRQGVYKPAAMPFTPGMEAVGEVIAVGPGQTGRKVGDLVAYGGNPMGAYAEEQILPASAVVPVPSSIDPVIAASVMIKGMTAQYLLRRCLNVQPGHTVLIHAATSATGSLLCQWANALGATVIGTVSAEEMAEQAKSDGCHHTILYKQEDFVSRVSEITSGKGVDVVYDSVGKDTFEGSLECLKVHGYVVLYGLSSGAPDPVPIPALFANIASGVVRVRVNHKYPLSQAAQAAHAALEGRKTLMQSNTVRDELLEASGELVSNIASGVLRGRVNHHKYPLSQEAQAHADLEGKKTLMQYDATQDELLEASGELFANIASGVLRVRVSHKYPLSQAAQAHADLESRKICGSAVLIPDGFA